MNVDRMVCRPRSVLRDERRLPRWKYSNMALESISPVRPTESNPGDRIRRYRPGRAEGGPFMSDVSAVVILVVKDVGTPLFVALELGKPDSSRRRGQSWSSCVRKRELSWTLLFCENRVGRGLFCLAQPVPSNIAFVWLAGKAGRRAKPANRNTHDARAGNLHRRGAGHDTSVLPLDDERRVRHFPSEPRPWRPRPALREPSSPNAPGSAGASALGRESNQVIGRLHVL